jgi:hypothetical protein
MWKNMDLEAGTLKVRRSVYDGVISPPKTSAGRRTIRLSKLGIAALKQQRILKCDCPRLPLTSNRALFAAFTEKGAELVGLHLMNSPCWATHHSLPGGR